MTADKPGLFEELKRRHVWRVAIAYVVAGWLLVQVVTQVFPFFGIPDWAVRLVVVLIVIGFPVALAFAWVYELTPGGVRRTAPADSPEARSGYAHRSVGQKLNAIIVVVLVLAVALLGWRLYAVRHAKPATPVAAAAAHGPGAVKRSPRAVPVSATISAAGAAASGSSSAPIVPVDTIPAKSVAVLPFTNESGNKDERFFSDGLSEDLITALSQFAGLKVISRNSAFQLRDSKASSAEIGKLLGVAHLLEGSVQHAGDEVRITATLVNAADGTVVWSQRYDKPYRDLFALQDAITRAVADALRAKLLTTHGAVVQSDRPPSGNLDAFAAYQHGIAYDALGTEAGKRQAVGAYIEATRIDPHYAAAYAKLSTDWLLLATQYGVPDSTQAATKAADAAATALALDPDLAQAHLARAGLLLNVDMDWIGAEAQVQRALQLSPNDIHAKALLSNLMSALGHNQRAVALARQVIQSDPRRSGGYYQLSIYLTALGRLDEARRAALKAIAVKPRGTTSHVQLMIIGILRGNAREALAAAQKEPPGVWHDVAMALALQIGSDRASADAALKKLIATHSDDAAYQVASVYALRGDADSTFEWLDRAWANRDSGLNYLLADPLVLRYRDDPRFAAFCKKVGLPTTTDAVAMK